MSNHEALQAQGRKSNKLLFLLSAFKMVMMRLVMVATLPMMVVLLLLMIVVVTVGHDENDVTCSASHIENIVTVLVLLIWVMMTIMIFIIIIVVVIKAHTKEIMTFPAVKLYSMYWFGFIELGPLSLLTVIM